MKILILVLCVFLQKSNGIPDYFHRNLDFLEKSLGNINISDLAIFDQNDSIPAQKMVPFPLNIIKYLICNATESKLDTISQGCSNQIKIVCQNDELLWNMFDASSKFPYTGLSYSVRQDLGNYDQCHTIDYSENEIRVLGKFCAYGLLIPEIPINDVNNITEKVSTAYKLATCIPDACSATDLSTLFFSYPLFTDTYCVTKETGTEFSAGDIAAIVVFCIFGFIIFLSTAYDFHTQRTEQKQTQLYIAFSVLTNGQKLFQSSSVFNREQILSFHGLKFISMMWIVAGHGFVAWQSFPVSNSEEVVNWLFNRYALYINTSHLAVDTFFFISGFLMAYQYLKQKPVPLGVHVLRVPQLIIHRYLRLTPALAMLYFFAITLNRHIVRGPIAVATNNNLIQPCKKYWYSFFLYLQNYYNKDDICINQTWYLSADMQMFIITPIVMIPIALAIKRHFKACMISLGLLNIILSVFPIFILLQFRDYQNEYDTHSRLVDYFMGFMFGAFMREKKDIRFPFSKLINFIAWIFTLLLMFAIVMVYQETYMNGSYESKSVVYTLVRPVWALCLAWIIFSCHHGYGGFANWILTLPVCQIGSKLTYCMYLVHGNIIVWYLLTLQNKIHFSDYQAFYVYCGHFTITVVLAIIWSLSFESPLIIIEKIVFGHGGERKPKVVVKSTAETA